MKNRRKHQKGHTITVHHRQCRSNGGADTEDNKSYVMAFLHRSWHNLFRNLHPEEICEIINETWLPKSYRFTCHKK